MEGLWEKQWEYLTADAAKCVNISDMFAASSSEAGRSPDPTVSTPSSVHPDYNNLGWLLLVEMTPRRSQKDVGPGADCRSGNE